VNFFQNLANLGHFYHGKSFVFGEIMFFWLKFGKILLGEKIIIIIKNWPEPLPSFSLTFFFFLLTSRLFEA
jgi:hypothetical protein